MKNERRIAHRKSVNLIEVSNLATLDPFSLLAKKAEIVDVSSTGLLLHIQRKELIPKNLRANLTLTTIEGEKIMLKISQMDLDLDGVVSRTKFVGNGIFEVAVDFSDEAPAYWRECLYDLLPGADEEEF